MPLLKMLHNGGATAATNLLMYRTQRWFAAVLLDGVRDQGNLFVGDGGYAWHDTSVG